MPLHVWAAQFAVVSAHHHHGLRLIILILILIAIAVGVVLLVKRARRHQHVSDDWRPPTVPPDGPSGGPA